MIIDNKEEYAYILHGECKSITRIDLQNLINYEDFIREKDHIVYFSLSDDG